MREPNYFARSFRNAPLPPAVPNSWPSAGLLQCATCKVWSGEQRSAALYPTGRMPSHDRLGEYHAVFQRVGEQTGGAWARQFTLIVDAPDADDAHLQAKRHEELLQGVFVLAGIRLVRPSQQQRPEAPDAPVRQLGEDFLALPPPWIPT